MSANPKSIRQTAGSGATREKTGSEERRRRAAEAAYYRAERRGFEGGHEEQDWLEAEKEIDDGCGDEANVPPMASDD